MSLCNKNVSRTNTITLKTPHRDEGFRTGDLVIVDQCGEGVIVGFTSYSGAPNIYVYTRQEVVCVSINDLTRV